MSLLSRLLKRVRGFNLIEMAIGLGIAAVVIGGVWVAATNIKLKRDSQELSLTFQLMVEHFKKMNRSPRPPWPSGYSSIPNGFLSPVTGAPCERYFSTFEGFRCNSGATIQLNRMEIYWTGTGWLDVVFGYIFMPNSDICRVFFSDARNTTNFSRVNFGAAYNTFPLSETQVDTLCGNRINTPAAGNGTYQIFFNF